MPLQVPAQIVFHQLEHADAVEADIRGKIADLEDLHDAIISCRVVVEPEHFNASGSNDPICARFELGLPGGKTIVGGSGGGRQDGFADAFQAVRAAYDAAHRQVHEYVERRRHFTKVHEVPPHGIVTQVDPTGEFGFLQTPDGLDVYFHAHAVIDGTIDDLEPGAQVRFILHAEEGFQGPQAASVQALGKHTLPNVEAIHSS